MRKGYVQVYTGTGKGKTTAALGLALRAAGAGLRTLIVQFIKKTKCSEHVLLGELGDRITIEQYGMGLIMGRKASRADIQAARKGYERVRAAMLSNVLMISRLASPTVSGIRSNGTPSSLLSR